MNFLQQRKWWMNYPILFPVIFLCCGHDVLAQKNIFQSPINEIDSLIEYNHFELAEKKADSLLQLLNTTYKEDRYAESRLEVRFQQGMMIDNQFEHEEALPIFMEVLDQAEEHQLHRLTCETLIRIAFNQEKSNNYDLAYKYLNKASVVCKKHHLEDLYGSIILRYALLHRFLADTSLYLVPKQRERLSKMGFKGNINTAVYYTEKAIEYGIKYKNDYDLNEAYVTMGILFGKKRKNRISESTAYFLKSIPYWKKVNNYEYVAIMYVNVAKNYSESGDFSNALAYNDSGFVYYDKMSVYYKSIIPKQRAMLFYELGQLDSAYHYQQMAHQDELNRFGEDQITSAKKLEEQYQNEKNKITIQKRNQLLVVIIIVAFIVIIASLLLFLQNRKIRRQNNTIQNHLDELQKLLNQKQVLLSELQHRVKNNLQQVISILDMQKESIDFNNIEELVRENQNRIHSMALLHRKLNIAENINSIDFDDYILELADLVSTSYYDINKNIQIFHQSSLGKTNIETALPLGLITVELLSNSLKHAFHHQSEGTIKISIDRNSELKKYQLRYSDNGSGFDFNPSSQKGLGLEIIKGLIDQLNGEYKINQVKGFDMTIYF